MELRQLRSFHSKPNARLDSEVVIALRLGAFQLLHLDRIPPRAAIDESVELTKQSGHRFASGMVNAVLRKLARAVQDQTADLRVKGTGFSLYVDGRETNRALAPEAGFSPAVAAHPAWMVDRWTRLFGPDAVAAICRHNQTQPPPAIRLASPRVD